MKYDNFRWTTLNKYKLFDMTPYCPLTLLSVNFKVFTRKYATTDVNLACQIEI